LTIAQLFQFKADQSRMKLHNRFWQGTNWQLAIGNRQSALVHALIGKSIAEAVLVGALAIFLFYSAFPPHFRGWGEVTEQGIAGWVVNTAAPYSRVEVELFIDGKFVASGIANQYRPDVRAAGWAKDDWHGYTFAPTSLAAGPHVARVYALHASGEEVRQVLQLVGDPLYFSVDETGKLIPAGKQK
jgi:hypothetical protein